MVAAWAAGGAALATLLLPAANPTRKSARAGHYDRVASCEDTVQDTVHYPLQYAMCSGERHHRMLCIRHRTVTQRMCTSVKV